MDRVFISGSAVGYYGDRRDELLTEAFSEPRIFWRGCPLYWGPAALVFAIGLAAASGAATVPCSLSTK